MNKILVALSLAVFLSACAEPSTDLHSGSRSSLDVASLPPPPILFGQSNQGHSIVILGAECCIYQWENITIEAGGDEGCAYHAPTSGPIMAGQLVRVLLPASDSQCSYAIAYDGLSLGNFLFAPPAPGNLDTAPIQPTQSSTPSGQAPPQGNGTVPP